MPQDSARVPEALVEEAIRTLAAMDRPSASEGERQAAEWLAERLRDEGLEPVVQQHPAVGGYWWSVGVVNAAALVALRLPRPLRLLLGAGAFAALWDDIHARRQLLRAGLRRVLPRRRVTNVVAEAGDRDAAYTLVVVGHHDAAHPGLIFHPGILPLFARLFPGQVEKATTSPPLMWGTALAPVLAALSAVVSVRPLRRLTATLGAATIATMADIGLRRAVPGANDNLTGSAVVLALARTLRERPVEGLRVLLVSTGGEEGFEEGMLGFASEWFGSLPPQRTWVMALDTVGSPHLCVPEREGMLFPVGYDDGLKDLLSRAAAAEDVFLWRGLNFSFATDALVAANHGYRAVNLGSVDELKAPANYHWPSDTPDNLTWPTVFDAVRVVDRAVRLLAEQARAES